jgi:hypothetical protein
MLAESSMDFIGFVLQTIITVARKVIVTSVNFIGSVLQIIMVMAGKVIAVLYHSIGKTSRMRRARTLRRISGGQGSSSEQRSQVQEQEQQQQQLQQLHISFLPSVIDVLSCIRDITPDLIKSTKELCADIAKMLRNVEREWRYDVERLRSCEISLSQVMNSNSYVIACDGIGGPGDMTEDSFDLSKTCLHQNQHQVLLQVQSILYDMEEVQALLADHMRNKVTLASETQSQLQKVAEMQKAISTLPDEEISPENTRSETVAVSSEECVDPLSDENVRRILDIEKNKMRIRLPYVSLTAVPDINTNDIPAWPSASGDSITTCTHIAWYALQNESFREKASWACQFDHEQHELICNLEDLKAFKKIGKSESPFFDVFHHLMQRNTHYGYVWQPKGFAKKAAEIDPKQEEEIRTFLLASTTDAAMRTYRQIVEVYKIPVEYDCPFSISKRECYKAFMETPLGETPV